MKELSINPSRMAQLNQQQPLQLGNKGPEILMTNRQEPAMIVLQQGVDSSKRWPLNHSKPVLIGRSEECDIVLEDRQISRFHARISWQDGQYLVEDLGSKNGTHVNGEKADIPMPLYDGDEFQLGLRCKLAFVDAGATAPLVLEDEQIGLHLDMESRQIWINGQLVEPALSLSQYRLLKLMWDSQGNIVTREEIVNTIWPEESIEGISEQAIDALVRRLRERLSELDGDFRYIVTVRGHGFRLNNRQTTLPTRNSRIAA